MDNKGYVDGQGLLLALSAAYGNLQTSLHFAVIWENKTTLLFCSNPTRIKTKNRKING